MAGRLVLRSPLIVLLIAVAVHVSSDLSALRSEVSYIDFTLRDMDRVLDQSPDADEIKSMRLRLQGMLNDIRTLSLEHQPALAFSPHELDSTYALFEEVRGKYEALGPPL